MSSLAPMHASSASRDASDFLASIAGGMQPPAGGGMQPPPQQQGMQAPPVPGWGGPQQMMPPQQRGGMMPPPQQMRPPACGSGWGGGPQTMMAAPGWGGQMLGGAAPGPMMGAGGGMPVPGPMHGMSAPGPPPAPQGAPGTSNSGAPPAGERRPSSSQDPAAREKQKAREKEKEKERMKKDKELKKKREEEDRLRQKKLDWIPASSRPVKLEGSGQFVAPYNFSNALPDVPCDPKLLTVSFNKEAFVRYRYDSAAEAAHKYELLAEPDLGIPIDLVDPHAYEAAAGSMVALEDQELLSDVAMAQATGARSTTAAARGAKLRQEVTWLRKTPIMGNNLYEAVHKQQKENTERQHVVSASRELATTSSLGRPSLQQQVDAIEKTFEEAAELDRPAAREGGLKHPTKPELTPVSVLPVLPDRATWPNMYVHMKFDADPAGARSAEALVKGFTSSEMVRRLSRPPTSPLFPAIPSPAPSPLPSPLRPCALRPSPITPAHPPLLAAQVGATEIKHDFLAYLLPKEKTADDDDAAADDEGAELEWVKEYQYNVRAAGDALATHFLAMQPDQVTYNEISTTISLKRKHFQNVMASRPVRITVARHEQNEEERATSAQEAGKYLLPPPSEPMLLTHKPSASDEPAAAPEEAVPSEAALFGDD